MARLLDVTQDVHYNGYDFPSPVGLKVRIQPVYDSADRIIKYRTYYISVETILTGSDFPGAGGIPSVVAGEPLDKSGSDAMKILRRLLTAPGGTLIIKQKGLGQDLTFSNTNTVGYGPKPRILAWEPIGDRQACRIVWECEVTAIECEDLDPGIYSSANVGEFTYAVNFAINNEGLTERTISGRLEVSPIRTGRVVDRTADAFRAFVSLAFPVPNNFHRTQHFVLTPDRRFLEFTISDSEDPSENPLYPHCCRTNISQTISGLWAEWEVSFNGRILVAPGQPRQIAWAAFVHAVKSRIEAWKANARPDDPENSGDIHLVPRRLSITEEIIGGRGMTFSLSFTGVTSLATIFKASGLWLPVKGSWAAWQSSMRAYRGPHYERGVSNIVFPNSADRIYNFCVSLPKPKMTLTPPQQRSPTGTHDTSVFALPPEDNSWMQYAIRLVFKKDNAVIYSRRVGESDAEHEISIDANKKTLEVAPGTATVDEDEIAVQDRGVSKWTVELHGTAKRYGHPIKSADLAIISTIDDKPAKQIGEALIDGPEKSKLQGAIHPVYVIRWHYTYALPSPKATLKFKKYPYTSKALPNKAKKK